MRSTFMKVLIEQARIDKRIYLITPDLGYSVAEEFIELFPERYINVGIAEQNAIGIAAGLALEGNLVYVYGMIPFLTMRCYEQIRLEMAYMNTNVRIVGVGAGLTYGYLGTTHHAIEDIAIMRALPNMTVLCPGDPYEVECLLKESFDAEGPMYFRLGKNGEEIIHKDKQFIKIGKGITLHEGTNVALIVTSNMLELGHKWCQEWEKLGVSTKLVSMPSIKPFDSNVIEDIIKEGIPIITLEEHNIIGGLGTCVAEVIASSGKGILFKKIGIQDEYSHFVGNHSYLREKFKLLEFNIIDFLKYREHSK